MEGAYLITPFLPHKGFFPCGGGRGGGPHKYIRRIYLLEPSGVRVNIFDEYIVHNRSWTIYAYRHIWHIGINLYL